MEDLSLKGQQIKDQLSLWDLLLYSRMNFQKVLINVNKLSKKEEKKDLECEESQDLNLIKSKSRKELENLLAELLDIKKILNFNEPAEKFIKVESATNSKLHENEIYNDDEFYRHLLRKIIESKSCVLDNQKWLQVQKLRCKMKRKVDTKCSKGRKIRYQVYKELVGFMSPIENNEYENNAKNALFSSLFGKKKFEKVFEF